MPAKPKGAGLLAIITIFVDFSLSSFLPKQLTSLVFITKHPMAGILFVTTIFIVPDHFTSRALQPAHTRSTIFPRSMTLTSVRLVLQFGKLYTLIEITSYNLP